MSKVRETEAQDPAGDCKLSTLFGSPPLLQGEDAAAYHELAARIYGAIAPTDAIEELWARDVVDLFWDSLRLRRLRTKLIAGSRRSALNYLCFKLTGRFLGDSMLAGWVEGDDEATRLVSAILGAAGLDDEAITAEATRQEIFGLEKIDRLILQRDACRNTALRELDRRRDARAKLLREISRDIDHPNPAALQAPQMRAAE